ncbi:CoA ester lyase [Hoeflea sp.]|uniref:HpcH/HpaI aldolase/citrate lyase family protein n=1 Tax=Hoeflea sp. TaxID=1940281 RepID=UPI00199BC57A|nr:CoA ester lyase [Hoeflea sp.]MBC7284704.1 CoA ester lyase [Hoeflea sp.]
MTIPRSYLFVPGDRPDRFDKAVATSADFVVLDLEDAVLPKGKTSAREAIRSWLSKGGRAAVRINGIGTEWHEEDKALLATPGVAAVILPKAEEPAALATFAAALPQGLPLVPLIESALGIWNARELASVHGVMQLAFGSVDFQLDTGIETEGEALLYARSRLVLASAIARIAPPVDGVTIALNDEEQLRADIKAARSLGFGGKLCIHPNQVLAVHEGFAPDDATLAWARAVVAAARTSDAGAVRLDGKLIDRPIVERAQRFLENARLLISIEN